MPHAPYSPFHYIKIAWGNYFVALPVETGGTKWISLGYFLAQVEGRTRHSLFWEENVLISWHFRFSVIL